jgi:hypothetical protein
MGRYGKPFLKNKYIKENPGYFFYNLFWKISLRFLQMFFLCLDPFKQKIKKSLSSQTRIL